MKAAVMVVSVVLLVAFLCVILHKFWQYSPYLTVLIPPPLKLNRPTKEYRISDVSRPSLSSDEDNCGQICSLNFTSKQDGRYYPLLRKTVNCHSIMRRMASPPTVSLSHPPRNPPPGTKDSFTMHGQCPLASRRWYFDNSKPTSSGKPLYYNAATFKKLMEADRNGKRISTYEDPYHLLKPTLATYRRYINNSHVAVLGTEKPWAEAMLMNLGPRRITTLEYRSLIIQHSRVKVITPYQFAANKKPTDLFDVVFSYSSLEHSGLGRYGDPIAPFGDAEAVAQMWCAVRPGGLFFLALPSFATADQRRRKCQILWNAHRLYGYVRLQHVTANWEVLDEVNIRDGYPHIIFVLRKLQ